jgi:hypothetical protein
MKIERNHLLLGALGLVVVFYFGDVAFRKLYEEPRKDNDRLERQLTKRMQAAKLELKKATNRANTLELLEKRSLPYSPELARERYQAWLLDLAKSAKMTDTNVDASDPVAVTATSKLTKRPYELYKRFSFTLHGRGDLNQVTQFLYDFYHAGHLHKIRSLSLNPLGQSPVVDMTVAVEALSLPTTEREMELTDQNSELLARSEVDDYRLIAQRNLFGRGGARWGWDQIVLRAVTTNVQGVAEAWFATGSAAGTEILSLGSELSLPAAELKVVALDDTSVTMDVEGQQYRLNIGQSLAEATPVTSPPADEPSPP